MMIDSSPVSTTLIRARSTSTAFPWIGTQKTRNVRIPVAMRASNGEPVSVTERRRGSRVGAGWACASVPPSRSSTRARVAGESKGG